MSDGAAIVAGAIISGILGPVMTLLLGYAISNHRKLAAIESTVNGTHAKAVDALAVSVAQNRDLAVENATLKASNGHTQPSEET
jgi:hypothetical protein